MKYKFLPHTADIKFQAFGNSLEECFENAGLALTNIICEEKIKPSVKKTIKVRGRDRESLLYNFLEEFLYLLEVGGLIVSEIKNIEIKSSYKIKNKKKFYDMELTADFFGDSSKNYSLEGNVKAVTYNDMWIKNPSEDGGRKFVCQVVVDV